MNPRFPINNSPDRRFTNAIFDCEHELRGYSWLVAASDFCRRFFAEFSQRLSKRWRSPHLLSAVADVIQFSPEPKMVRANTTRIVSSGAVVQDVKSVWDWPIGHKPRKSVSTPMVEMMPEFPIPVFVETSGPDPAGFSFLDLTPKNELRIKPALFGAAAAFAVPWILLEFFSADRTVVSVHLKPFLLGVQRLVVNAISLVSFNPKAA